MNDLSSNPLPYALTNINPNRNTLILVGIVGLTILGIGYITTNSNYSITYKNLHHSFSFSNR